MTASPRQIPLRDMQVRSLGLSPQRDAEYLLEIPPGPSSCRVVMRRSTGASSVVSFPEANAVIFALSIPE